MDVVTLKVLHVVHNSLGNSFILGICMHFQLIYGVWKFVCISGQLVA